MTKTMSDQRVRAILKLPYSRMLVPDETGGYTSEIMEFRGCFSEGDTPEEAFSNLEEAAFNWVKAALKQGLTIPPPFSTEGYAGRFVLRLPKTIHRQAAEMARRDNVSLNQFVLSAVSARLGVLDLFERLEELIDQKLEEIANTQTVFYEETPTPVWLKLEVKRKPTTIFATVPSGAGATGGMEGLKQMPVDFGGQAVASNLGV